MKKVQVIIMCVVTGLLISACNAPVNYSTKTYVKDLVETDVYEAIANPAETEVVRLFDNSGEIEGEYLELAQLEVEEVSDHDSTEHILDILKSEARKVGANGVLIVKSTSNIKGGVTTQNWAAIAVYTFEEMPEEDGQIVML